MVDIFETNVKLKFVVSAGEVDRIKKLVEAATSGSFLGRTKGIGPLVGGKGMSMLGAAGAAGAIIMSSPSLQNTLKALTRTVMMLIRPIGDIISIGLRPIIDILRPIGMFFRILIKPYIDAAKKAMTLGRKFAAKGETGLAAEAYALGVGFLLKPFFDMMVTTTTIGVQGILAGIKLLGQGLIELLDPLDLFPTASRDFGTAMDKMILSVGEGGATIITDTSVMMYDWLIELQKGYDLIKNQANVQMGLTAGFAGEGFVRIIEAATSFFVTSDTVKTQIETVFDNIVEYGRKKVEELNALLNVRNITTGYATERERVAAMSTAERAAAATMGGTTGYWAKTGTVTPADIAKAVADAQVAAIKSFSGGGGTSGAGDFIWRSGQKPMRFSSNDTLVGAGGETPAKSITVGDIVIRIDRVSSDVDMRRMSNAIKDQVINALRTMI
jgi:hypothetical protein